MASEWDVVSHTPVKGEWDVVSHTPTPPEQSTLAQIGQYVNERLNPSPETEKRLQDFGVYNKPGEISPLKALNRGVMNPIMGLFGGGLQIAGDAIHGGLKLVNDAGNAISPGLGRDLAAIGEMAIGSGRFGVSGKFLGKGFTIPDIGSLNLARVAQDAVRKSALEKVSNLENVSRVAAAAEDTAGAARVADADAQTAQFGRKITLENKKARQLGDEASQASSAQVVAETPRPPVASPFGEPPSSAGIGQSVQSAAIDREAGLRSARGAEYTAGTADVEKAVAEKEASGIFLKDDPKARALLAQSRRALDDTPIPGSPAAERLSAPDRMAHEAVVSALEGRPVQIPESMVAQMEANGHKVSITKATGDLPPTYSVTFSNTVDGVNNVRRMFGEAFKSDVAGWGAINSSLKKYIYSGLDDVLRSYVGKAYTARQAKYRDASPSIEAYRTQIGQQLIADQKGTAQPRTTANALAERINQADPAEIDEVRKLSRRDPLPGIVAQAFHDPVTGMSISLDAARKATAPGTKLADALAAHPELNAAVRNHISALEAEENATIQQSLFAQQQKAIAAQKLADQIKATNRAEEATKGQTEAQKLADKLGETSAKDAAKLRETETAARQDIANLERMPAKEVLPYARAMLERMSPAKGGHLTMEQYTAALTQLDKAKSTADLQRRLLRIVGAGLAVAGAPTAGRVVYNSITGGP